MSARVPGDFQEWMRAFQRIGRGVPYWTQGRGGNLSLKDETGFLWVKATGMRLEDVRDQQQLARIDLKRFVARYADIERDAGSDRARAEQRYTDLLRECRDPQFAQPSMETAFHAVLPARWVLHFHSLPAVLLAQRHFDARDADDIERLFQRHALRTCWVDHAVPGRELAAAVMQSPDSEAFVMRNHGVILQGSGPDVLTRWEALEKDACARLGWSGLLEPAGDAADAFPLRIYFPDTAVFVKEVRSALKPVRDDFYRLPARSEADVKDRDFIEIAQATRALYRACPELDEIPADIAARVSGLPTEDIRRAITSERSRT